MSSSRHCQHSTKNAQWTSDLGQSWGTLCDYVAALVWWCFWKPLKTIQQAHQHVYGQRKPSWAASSTGIFCSVCSYIPTCIFSWTVCCGHGWNCITLYFIINIESGADVAIRATNKDPICCFKADKQTTVCVVLRVPYLPANNLLQSEEASHMGGNANRKLRKSTKGGPVKTHLTLTDFLLHQVRSDFRSSGVFV